MTDIFISYAYEDQERVRPIVKELEKHGWIVFWDKNIPPGETWENSIGQALEESHCVLAVWSYSSVNSDWVKEEAEEAKEKGVLVPLFLDICQGVDVEDIKKEKIPDIKGVWFCFRKQV